MVRRRIPDHLRLAFLRFAAEVAERRRHLWTDAEREYLREHYTTTPTRQIAATLARPVALVMARANKMGLYKERRRRAVGD